MGKKGAMWKGKHYVNYYCSRAMRGRALCATYNGHSARKLETAILEYLGQFSNPHKVREHMAAAERRQIKQREAELRTTENGLAELEARFVQHLGLLNRRVIDEAEFTRANESIRGQRVALAERQQDLEQWLGEQRNKVSAAKRMPEAIRSFLEDFRSMDVRVQKAKLQTILAAAHVHRDGKIELDFRS